MSQPSDPALRRWLQHNIARGCVVDDLVQTLVEHGHVAEQARAWVDFAVANPEALAADVNMMANPIEENQFQDRGVLADLGSLSLDVRMKVTTPGIVLIENFLRIGECAQLMAEAESRLKESTVVDPATGEYRLDNGRVSEGMSFAAGANVVVSRIERLIERHFGYSLAQQEDLQILHYGVGGEYKAHFDYFDPNLAGSLATLRERGQRIATFVIYLQTAEEGGGTSFPDLGLHFSPKAGSLIYFENVCETPTGLQLESRSLHAGLPVTLGDKWIATKWIRQPKKLLS